MGIAAVDIGLAIRQKRDQSVRLFLECGPRCLVQRLEGIDFNPG